MAATSSSSSSLLSDNPIISAPSAAAVAVAGGSSSSSSGAALDDSVEDACSICLEPFTLQDPSTITCCKHEYHLQCILEWSQRSKECPICWQLLSLKDPVCQELLAAVETERRLRSRNTSSAAAASSNLPHFHEDFDPEQDSYSDDSDFDERIMQHIASVASSAHYIRRRERQRSSGQSFPQVLSFPSPANAPTAQQTHTSAEEGRDVYDRSSAAPMASQLLPSVDTAVSRDVPSKPRVFFRLPSDDAPQTPSEGLSLSDSIKSKWANASARYKESIFKSTRGIKEKLLARNDSVKELSKGVQREMSAGIAGVARMIERLDLTPKRTGTSSPVPGFRAGTSDISLKGKSLQENIIAQSVERKSEEMTHVGSLGSPLHASCTISSLTGDR